MTVWLTNVGWVDSPRYVVSFEGDKSGCENFPIVPRDAFNTVVYRMKIMYEHLPEQLKPLMLSWIKEADTIAGRVDLQEVQE